MASDAADSTPSGERHLLVRAGVNRYAIPTRVVRRVVPMPDLYRVPGAHPQLIGLGQYRGEPLAIVDMEALESETGAIGGNREVVVVIAPGDGVLVGLAADDAEQVSRLGYGGADDRLSDGPISAADRDGVKRLDPSWFLERREGRSEDAGQEST